MFRGTAGWRRASGPGSEAMAALSAPEPAAAASSSAAGASTSESAAGERATTEEEEEIEQLSLGEEEDAHGMDTSNGMD